MPYWSGHIFSLLLLLGLLLPTQLPASDTEHGHPSRSGDGAPNWLDERLGEHLPLELPFVDAAGRQVLLSELIDGPTLVVPVYYRCRNVCNQLLGGLARVLPELKLSPGEDYRILTLSIDAEETPAIAARSKQTFLTALQGEFPPQAWHFLTGEEENIRRLTDAAGYRFQKQGNDFLHPVAAFVVTADGRIVRYLNGFRFLPLDLTMALVEAEEDRIGKPIRKLISFCFSYDPQGRRYVFNLLRVSGSLILLTLGSFLLYLLIGGRRK